MPSESDGGNGSEGTSGASAEARGGLGGGQSDYSANYAARQGFGEKAMSTHEMAATIGMSASDFEAAVTSPDKDRVAEIIDAVLALGAPVLGVINGLIGKVSGTTLGSAVSSAISSGSVSPAEGEKSLSSIRGDAGSHGDYRNSDATNSISNTGEPAVSSLVADAFNPGSTSGNTAFADWTAQKAGLDAQAGDINMRGNAAYDTLSGLAQAPNTDLDALRSEVAKYGTQAFQDANAGRAVADVQQASDAQYGEARRDMLRTGVDPSSGRALAMGNQRAMGTALGTAQAANTSRAADATRYASGLNTVNTAANADRTQRMDLLTNANKLGASGFSAGADVAKLGLSFGTAADTASTNRYQAESGRINANNKVTETANQQNQYDSSNDFWSNVTKAAGNNLVNTLTSPKSDLSIFKW